MMNTNIEQELQLLQWKIDAVKYSLFGLDNIRKIASIEAFAGHCHSMLEEIQDAVYYKDTEEDGKRLTDFQKREIRYGAIKCKMDTLKASSCFNMLKIAKPEYVSNEELIKMLNTIHEIFLEDFGFE